MSEVTRTRRRVAACGLAVAAALALVPAARAGDASCAGPVQAVGVLGPTAPLAGTGRPAAALVTRGSAGPAGAVLAGVLVPSGADPGAIAAALSTLAAGEIAVHAMTPRTDRRGRLVGAVSTADGRYLQADLLARGLVVADGEDGPCAGLLAAAEREARRTRRGLWSGQGALPRPADAADGGGLPDFLVAGGVVLSVGKAGATTYLNFGRRFADDLTVRIAPKVAEALAARGSPPAALAGRRVIVRGWAEARNGIDLPLASAAALDGEEGSGPR